MAFNRPLVVLVILAILNPCGAWAWSPPKRAAEAKMRACPEVGEGFVRLPGSDTCVRLNGLVRVEGMKTGGTR